MALIEFENKPSKKTAMSADNINHNFKELNEKFKTAMFDINITPNVKRGSSGFGSNSLDISSLNAESIIGYYFTNSSNFMLWGVASIDTQAVNYYGYRIAGDYDGNINANIIILYV